MRSALRGHGRGRALALLLAALAGGAPRRAAAGCAADFFSSGGGGGCVQCPDGTHSLASASHGSACRPYTFAGPLDTVFSATFDAEDGLAQDFSCDFGATIPALSYVTDRNGNAASALYLDQSHPHLLSMYNVGTLPWASTAGVPWSISMDILMPTFMCPECMLQVGYCGDNQQYMPLFVSSTGFTLYAHLGSVDSTAGSAFPTPVAGSWYRLTHTYDGTSAKLYVDGVLAWSGVRAWSWPNAFFNLGCHCWGCNNGRTDAVVDDLRIYSRTLSPAEVAALTPGRFPMCAAGTFSAAGNSSCTACPQGTYSYGTSAPQCASCPPGAAIVSSTAGCAPSAPPLMTGPSDTAFFFSGAQAEGVAAFTTFAAPQGASFANGPFGAASAALALASGSYLGVPGASAPAALPSGGSVAWSASAWVKCAAPSTYAAVLEWGAVGDAGAGSSPQALALVVGGVAPLANSGVVGALAGSGSAAFADGAGVAASFSNPSGLAFVASSGLLVVADRGNNLVRLVSLGVVTTLAASASPGFSSPYGIAVDPRSDFVFLADTGNSLVRKISPEGVVSTFALSGGGQLSSPYGVAVSPATGAVVVADTFSNRVLVFSAAGNLTQVVGGAYAFADGAGTSASFAHPTGVAVIASTGVLVVVDSDNCAIRLVTPSGLVTTLAGGSQGAADGQGAAAKFNHPISAAVIQSTGTIVVADTNNNLIRLVSPAGAVTTLVSAGLSSPYGVAVSPATGALVVADTFNHRLRLVTLPAILPACDATWHHVALTYSVASSPYILSAFLDGALVFAQVAAITLPPASASSLRIGWSGDLSTNAGSRFSGTLADLRVYNRTLAASEVLALSQPPVASFLSVYSMTVAAPSSPTAGATAYAFSCAAGATGSPATYVRSPVDGSWGWAGGATPSCLACAAGSFAAAGASACTACPQGAFSAAANALACTPCPQGTSTHSGNSSSAGACSVCAPGFYGAPSSPGLSGAGCTACPAGVTSAAVGGATAAACTVCAPGFFGSVTSGAGTATATGCTACPMGTTTPSINSTTQSACSVCAPGFYGSVIGGGGGGGGSGGGGGGGGSGCVPCPPGYSTGAPNSASASACVRCAAGFFSAPTPGGASACFSCPAGTFAAAANTAASCAACSAGFWSASGSAACVPCPAGTYALSGAATCSLCPAGTFGESAGLGSPACSGACASCAAGSTAAAASAAQSPSPSGSPSTSPTASLSPTPTPTPTPTLTPSSTPSMSQTPSRTPSPSASPCTAGSFPLAAGACAPCSPGTYALAGAAACSLCPAGTFGSHAGLETAACSGPCASCTAGSTSPAALSCVAADARAVPASLGLQLWPAAHPSNPQRVDLVVAPLAQCQQMASAAACAAAATVNGADGVTRYVVGTAAAFNMEADETLTCAA